ncbi:MAG: MBL fold metallo-hydrolase [Chloroflexi bacterium]|nr:MBL fold metallo-hydrolase [Chloroflexota bacterium]
MIWEHVVVGPLQVNCFILGCEDTRDAVVIDPGGHPQAIRAVLARHGLRLRAILATHAHFDHILGVDPLREGEDVPFYLHPADEPVLQGQRDWVRRWLGYDPGEMPRVDAHLVPGEPFRLGCIHLEVAHTPGHSPGSVTFLDWEHKRAYVGDLIFASSVGRTDIPGGDYETLMESLRRVILPLPDEMELLPGHGLFTTVGRERLYNPYLRALIG